jgi:hypothetical protein
MQEIHVKRKCPDKRALPCVNRIKIANKKYWEWDAFCALFLVTRLIYTYIE